jgi:hypothetical protein
MAWWNERFMMSERVGDIAAYTIAFFWNAPATAGTPVRLARVVLVVGWLTTSVGTNDRDRDRAHLVAEEYLTGMLRTS